MSVWRYRSRSLVAGSGPLVGGVLWLGVAAFLAGCSGQGGLFSAAGLTGSTADAPCLDDSKACIKQRMVRLKAMLDDTSRRWVEQRPSRVEYASGVRLFAYRATKRQLDCRELHAGKTETEQAKASLAAGPIPGLGTQQLAKVKALNDQVHNELAREFRRVCKSSTQARRGFQSRAPKGRKRARAG